MASRYIFKKWNASEECASCFDCSNKTLFYITDKKTGEDFPICTECALKQYKIKRLKNLLRKYPLRKKKTISGANPRVKNAKNACMGRVSEKQQVLEVGE